MAEDKNSFILYTDQREHFDELTDEQAGKLVKHMFAYVNDENPIAPDTVTRISFISIKNQLKRDLEKYEEKRGGNSKAGREGNLKRWALDIYDKYKAGEMGLEEAEIIAKDRKASPPDNSESPPIAKIAVTVTDTVTANATVILLEKETKAFNDFWDLYDKKINPTKCKPKFLKLSENDRKLIMEYIPKYKLSQPNKKFRKDPLTFLNNDGWLDEIITEQKEESKPFIYKY
jgi:hypothetical protein